MKTRTITYIIQYKHKKKVEQWLDLKYFKPTEDIEVVKAALVEAVSNSPHFYYQIVKITTDEEREPI